TDMGPDLTKVEPKLLEPKEVLLDLLEPSARINEKYYSYTFGLTSGKVVTGLILEETPDMVKVIENPLAKTQALELKKSDILERQPWLALYQDAVRLPSGRCLDDFYRVVLPDYVLVAAFTPTGQLVMVRGYKHGLGRVSLFAPAGHLDPGEEPLQGARRELFE